MEAPVNKPSILLHCKAQICCKSGVKGWTDIHISGRWQAPAAVLPEGPKTRETVTRGPEGPESGSNTRVRGPEGPEDEQSSVFVSALASATICFSQLSPKSRFSRLNLDTLIAA